MQQRIGFVIGLIMTLGMGNTWAQFSVLHGFTGEAGDGANPYGSLTLSGKILYGMTSSGGASNHGVIFKINTDGSGYTNLHEFTEVEGLTPTGSLILLDSALYGMTTSGGAGGGVIFRINTDGTSYTNLHVFFGGQGDGLYPFGSLILKGSTVYGMTAGGGVSGQGAIFRINVNGTGYTNLHEFIGGPSDGQSPYDSLALSGATLYGMTYSGGASNLGVVFKVNTDGTGYTNLHEFAGSKNGNFDPTADGANPYGSLVVSGSTLYGMTYGGGAWAGIIFCVQTNGSDYTILREFAGGTPWGADDDGASPYGSLSLSGSTLYGMSFRGGPLYLNLGVIFRLSTDGSDYTGIHQFTNSISDATQPRGSLTLSGPTIYGMTYAGGVGNKGTIFTMRAPPTNVKILLQRGSDGTVGLWSLGANYQPATWTPISDSLGGRWMLRGLNQRRMLLQQGLGGLIGMWGTTNNLPNMWWQVSGPLAGWIARDIDGNRILLQQGDGGVVGIWTLNPSNTPVAWTHLSGPIPGLIARALAGNRVLVQFGAGTPIGYWTLDAGNNITAWTQLNVALPAGWILRDLTQNYILLQAGDGGMVGLWGLDANGVPNAWYPVAGAMPGWIMRAIEEQ